MGADAGQLAGDGHEEGGLAGRAVHAHDVTGLHLQRVPAQDRCECFQTGGGHDAEGYPARAATTASSRRPAPYRTGASGDSPVWSVASPIAARASSSARWLVFSETGIPGPGRTYPAIRW